MTEQVGQRVIGTDGFAGTIVTPEGSTATDEVLVQLDTGARLVVPRSLLAKRDDTSYTVPLALEAPATSWRSTAAAADTASFAEQQAADAIIVPVIAEELSVAKRRVETGRVRVNKTVHERTQTVDEPLLRETVAVERVPINQVVDHAPQVRYEGDTTIIPVLEEVLVVEKRLMLREEIRLTKQQTTYQDPQQVTLRREEVTVERSAGQREAEDGTV